jgi:hypothetical protein
MQLVAYGAQDIYLTGNPQITFFKVVYRRHTNFSCEVIEQTISGTSTLGTSTARGIVTVARNGDLLGRVYCTTDTAGVTSGDKLISTVEVEIGGQRIDKHTQEWMQVWNELTCDASKADAFKAMTGCVGTSGSANNGLVEVQVPLQFWFCRNPGLALPLIALQYHEVKFIFEWDTSTNAGVAAAMKVWCEYIYLDTDERRRFAQVSHEYLIEQLQYQTEGTAKSTYTLTLNHPVKELVWTEAASVTTQKAKLKLNGHDRFAYQRKEYFQLRQPFEHHTAVPRQNIPEVGTPELLATPIVVTSAIDAVAGDTPNADTEFQVLAATTSNLKLYSATAADIDIQVGDILSMVYPVAANEYASVMAKVAAVVTAPADTAVAVYTVNFTAGMGTANTPAASTAGDGSLHVVARTQNSLCRTSSMTRNINCYSFALEPEEHQPSGTCNFSRIDTAQLAFDGSVTVQNIYATNYNVLRIMSGMGGLAYSN